MVALRLQGVDATATESMWVGLSHFLPGGGAEKQASGVEKVYVVLSGEVTLDVGDTSTVLGPLDSCVIPAGEERVLRNDTNSPTSMLVIMPVVTS